MFIECWNVVIEISTRLARIRFVVSIYTSLLNSWFIIIPYFIFLIFPGDFKSIIFKKKLHRQCICSKTFWYFIRNRQANGDLLFSVVFFNVLIILESLSRLCFSISPIIFFVTRQLCPFFITNIIKFIHWNIDRSVYYTIPRLSTTIVWTYSCLLIVLKTFPKYCTTLFGISTTIPLELFVLS